jgi:hypothetical protein
MDNSSTSNILSKVMANNRCTLVLLLSIASSAEPSLIRSRAAKVLLELGEEPFLLLPLLCLPTLPTRTRQRPWTKSRDRNGTNPQRRAPPRLINLNRQLLVGATHPSTGVDEYELVEWEGGAPGGGAYAAGLSSAGLGGQHVVFYSRGWMHPSSAIKHNMLTSKSRRR